jgi:hypothetical protein
LKLVAELFFNRPMDKLDLCAGQIIRLSKFNNNPRTVAAAAGRAAAGRAGGDSSASVDNGRVTAVKDLSKIAKTHFDNAFGSLGTSAHAGVEASVPEVPNSENLFMLLRYFWMTYHAFGVDGI